MIIKTDPDIIQGYFEDTSNLQGGRADAVVIPETVAELSRYVEESNRKGIPMTVAGGGTGTTGSRIPFGGTVISLEKFTRLGTPPADRMSITAEAAVPVDDLKTAAESAGLFYTCHPTERSATLGGTVATNASGQRSFKYGPTRRYVRAIEMVMPTGEAMTVRRGERFLTQRDPSFALPGGRTVTVPLPSYRMPEVKHAAGYYAKDGMDLIDLFIGQEGTLSIITGVEMGLVRRPEKIFSAFVFFDRADDAWAFAIEARELSRRVRAQDEAALDALSIEYLDANALALLAVKYPRVPQAAQAAIFFEQETTVAAEEAVLDRWLALIEKHRASPDASWVAMTEDDAERFNIFRHTIPESVNEIVRRNGFRKLSTDIAVPDGKLLEMMQCYTRTLRECGMHHVVFGHIGESHIHANILPRSAEEAARGKEIVTGFVRKGVALGGTVSAEHGIGKIKREFLEIMYGTEGIRDMARIKKAIDPHWLLGLDTLFPREVVRSL